MELKVLDDCKQLVKKTVMLCDKHPSFVYTLNPQMIRASVSVGSNVVEGSRRTTNKEYVHFLNIAIGSCDELKFQLICIEELTHDYLSIELIVLCDNIIGKLVNLKRYHLTHLKPQSSNLTPAT